MEEKKDFEFYENKTPNLIEGQKFFDTSFSHENEKTIFGKREDRTQMKQKNLNQNMDIKKMKK